MTTHLDTDVLIIGSGLMGATVAALVRAANTRTRIVMVDAGPPLGDHPGQHLHESTDPDTWNRYNQRVATGIQGLYAGDETYRPAVGHLDDLEPGMHRLRTLGQDADDLPGAALAWNTGGMSVHWTAATPTPARHERFGDPDRWERDLATARRLLRISDSPLGPSKPGQRVLDVLADRFGDTTADRLPQPMPMAVTVDGERRIRTGPATVFPALADDADEHFRLLTETIARTITHQDGHARGAIVEHVPSGTRQQVDAALVVVCADALRTPQLLFASDVRPPALGRYLNEHAFISNRVILDLDRFDLELADLPRILDGEFVSDSLWLPASESQPLQAQIMSRPYLDEDARPLAYGVGISIYVPLESRADNRLRFGTDLDITGMPRMSIDFTYSPADHAAIHAAVETMATIGADLGTWNPETDSKLLPAGSSLHMTGTVRSGDTDDGTSVCDPSGRIWGFDNLFVAGNGVIPTAMAGNVTLTGVVTAIRAAEATISQLKNLEDQA